MKKLLMGALGFVLASSVVAQAEDYDAYPSFTLTNVQYGEYVMAVNGSNGCVATNTNTTDASHQFKLIPADLGLFYFYNVGTQTYAKTISSSTQATFTATKAEALQVDLTIDGDKFLIKNNGQYFNCFAGKNVGGWGGANTGSQWTYSLVDNDDQTKMSAFTANITAMNNLQNEVYYAGLKKERTLGGAFVFTPSQFSSNAKHNGEGSYEALLSIKMAQAYFHSTWYYNSSDNDYHYLAVAFDNDDDCTDFTFTFTPRPNNANNRPTEIHLYGSTDGGQTWEANPFKILTEADGLNPSNNNQEGRVTFTADKVYNALKFSVRATNTGQTPSDNGGSDSTHPFFTYGTVQLWRTGYVSTDTDKTKANLMQAAIDKANSGINAAWTKVFEANAYTPVANVFAQEIDDANGRALHPLFTRENLATYPTVKFYNVGGRGGDHWMTYNENTNNSFAATANANHASATFKLVPTGTEGHYYIYNIYADRFYGAISASSEVFLPVAWDGNVADFKVRTLADGTRSQVFNNDPEYADGSFLHIHLNGSWKSCGWEAPTVCSQWYVVLAGEEEQFATNLSKLEELNSTQALAQAYLASIENAPVDATLRANLVAAVNAAVSARLGEGADFEQLIADMTAAVDALKADKTTALRLGVTDGREQLNAIHGSVTEYNTPGYVPFSNAAVKALYDAVIAAEAALEAESTELDGVSTALSAALTNAESLTLEHDATCEISAGALYRISNHGDNRGSLYYKDGSDYVYSTGKTAFAGSADDDCMLWGVINDTAGSTTHQYLYNAARKAFVYYVKVQDGQNGHGWSLVGNVPTYITIAENESKYPVVELTGHNQEEKHMSISNSYPAPLIEYYTAGDGGVKFRFEYVRPAGSLTEEMTAAIADKASEELDPIKDSILRFKQISETRANENWTVGHRTPEAYADMCEALDILDDVDATYNDKFNTVINAYATWYNSPRVMPEHDVVYTIESVHAGHTQYLYNDNGTLALAVDPQDLESSNKYRWHCQVEDGKYSFSNYREVSTPAEQEMMLLSDAAELITTQVVTNGCEGGFTIEGDATQEGYVNLKQKYAEDESTRYLVTKNDAENPSFNRTTNLSADPDYPGRFKLVAVGAGSDDAITSGISEINADSAAKSIYDLQGRKVVAPVKGINIIGGRKVLVK